MAITALEPKTALLLIDLQKGMRDLPLVHTLDEIAARAATLAAAFRRRHLPVVLVNVAGAAPGRVEQARRPGNRPADWTELLPELNRQPTDHIVTKRTFGAFTNTGLADHLQQAGVTQVVLAGVSTSIGVESTARFAQELGFHVAFAVDAMTDTVPEAHENSIRRIFPRVGETGTTEEILGLLERLPA